jgi:hypothetical protein
MDEGGPHQWKVEEAGGWRRDGIAGIRLVIKHCGSISLAQYPLWVVDVGAARKLVFSAPGVLLLPEKIKVKNPTRKTRVWATQNLPTLYDCATCLE